MAVFGTDVDVVELTVDQCVVLDHAVLDDHRRLADQARRGAGATAEGDRFDVVLVAGRIDLGIQRIQREFGGIARLPLQGAGHAQALLLMLHLHVAREARVVDVGRTGGGERRGRVEVAVARAVGPAAGVGAFFQRLALGIGHRQQRTEGAVGEGVGNQCGHARVGFFSHRVVTGLAAGGKGEAVIVERARGAQVDRGPQRAFLDVGRGGLAHHQLREQVRGEHVEVEAAAAVGAAALVTGTDRGQRFHAVDAHAGEIRAQATHGDVAAFARFAGDDHAGDALQRLGQVQIRELADILGDDGVDHAGFAALDVQRLLDTGAVAGDDDGIQIGGVGPRILGQRGTTQRQADRQCEQGNRCLFLRVLDLHVFPLPRCYMKQLSNDMSVQ